MSSRRVAPVLAAFALGLCLSGGSPAGGVRALDPTRLALPSQGLAVQHGNDLVLIGLNGHVYGRLAGFRLAGIANLSAANISFQQLGEAVGDRTLLVHLHEHWYELDGKGLHALKKLALELPGGTTLVAHPKSYPDGGFSASITIERAGHRVTAIPPDDFFGMSGGLLYGSSGTVFNPASGRVWRTHECVPAGLRGESLLALCDRTRHGGPLDLDLFSRDGAHRRLETVSVVPIPVQGDLSPDGRYVAASASFGCGPSYTFVVPLGGGATRTASGERRQPFTASQLLGWSANNRLVAYLAHKATCEGQGTAGVYEIDPRTFARRLVAVTAGRMWNPAP